MASPPGWKPGTSFRHRPRCVISPIRPRMPTIRRSKVTDTLPTFAELRQRTDAPPGSSWGIFADDAQRGMANFAGVAEVLRSRSSIVEGRVFNLDYRLDAFQPGLFPERKN